MRIGSLFTGAAMLDEAVRAVFGGQIVWHCESDKAASAVLAKRHPDIPNLGDITKVDWDAVEPVDVICGGFPCQDMSAAGRRAGMGQGTRSGLWVYMADAIAALRPRYVVVENVRGILSTRAHRTVENDESGYGPGDLEPEAGALGDNANGSVLRCAGAVLGDLADLGFDAEWTTLSASAVGACHRRERWFCIAYSPVQLGAGVAAGDGGERAVDPSGARAGDRDRAGDSAARVPVVGRGTGPVANPDAVTASDGRDQGRAEHAGVERGSDAAVGGAAAGQLGLLLPTPCVNDMGDDKTAEWWDEFVAREKAKGYNGNGHGRSLSIEVRRAEQQANDDDGLLPTPTSRDHKGRNQRDDQTCLPGALLPTPVANDYKGADPKKVTPENATKSRGEGGASSLADVCLLPTPVVTDASSSARHTTQTGVMHPGTSLTDALRQLDDDALLPTPNAHDGDRGKGPRSDTALAQGKDARRLDRQKGLPDLPRLLPTPAAADQDRRQDYARAQREGSGGDDLVTAAVKATNNTDWGKYEAAIRRWEQVTRPHPPPTEPNTRGNPRLSPKFSEWMMGWGAGWVTDAGIGRNDQLRIIGNGVVPQQAAAALVYLLQTITATVR